MRGKGSTSAFPDSFVLELVTILGKRLLESNLHSLYAPVCRDE